MEDESLLIEIRGFTDIARAVGAARRVARVAELTETDQFLFGTAVSEMATNIARYAKEGVVHLRTVRDPGRQGVEAVASDSGPGIEDIDQAMQDHFSTSDSLGLGLASIKRIMDEFDIESSCETGTRVTVRKWV